MKLFIVFYVILLVLVARSFTFDAYEDYFDPVLNYLLNGNDTELSELIDNNNEKLDTDSVPVFLDGIWKCGHCDEINEDSLIYNEINDVDTNIDDDNFLQVQVGLAFDEMRCVTIQSDEVHFQVKRIAGACTGPTVTLYVSNAQHFDVKVFRD